MADGNQEQEEILPNPNKTDWSNKAVTQTMAEPDPKSPMSIRYQEPTSTRRDFLGKLLTAFGLSIILDKLRGDREDATRIDRYVESAEKKNAQNEALIKQNPEQMITNSTLPQNKATMTAIAETKPTAAPTPTAPNIIVGK